MRSSRSNIDIGIVLNLSPVYSASDSPADTMLASREDVRRIFRAQQRIHVPAHQQAILARRDMVSAGERTRSTPREMKNNTNIDIAAQLRIASWRSVLNKPVMRHLQRPPDL